MVYGLRMANLSVHVCANVWLRLHSGVKGITVTMVGGNYAAFMSLERIRKDSPASNSKLSSISNGFIVVPLLLRIQCVNQSFKFVYDLHLLDTVYSVST